MLAIVALVVGVIAIYLQFYPRVRIPTHLKNHPAVVVENLIDKDLAKVDVYYHSRLLIRKYFIPRT